MEHTIRTRVRSQRRNGDESETGFALRAWHEVFDNLGQQAVRGKVASISALSNTQTGDAEYTAYIDFEPMEWIRQGMSVTVTFMN